jgi:rRNA maturation RNase YbeY
MPIQTKPASFMGINFYIEPPLDYQLTNVEQSLLTQWLHHIITSEGYGLQALNFILCTDGYLHQMNLQYLNHDTLTDVITFDNSDEVQQIEGDIFISYERIIDNANNFEVSAWQELCRVMAHGTLHLLGYGDKTPTEKQQMRAKENHYLALNSAIKPI